MDPQEFKKLCKGKEVTVKADDLYALLSSIGGPPHILREQLVIMDMNRKLDEEHFILNLENALIEAVTQEKDNGNIS
ncbi:MAG: hypothetical protein CL582_16800 [Alteromonadaceae bacterium]|nr:hypothetical protein [Alteromonadaceae bacterium]|tara:strand:- start:37 stop:267 length:231 start_codon:yes stop_codon:yes gene_type:complete